MYKAIVILLILGVHQATSLTCYQCRHDDKENIEDPDCLDPFEEDKVKKVDCADERKCIIVKIERKEDQKTTFFGRDCVPKDYTCENFPVDKDSENKKCRTCSTNLCNSMLDEPEPEPTTTTQSMTTSTTQSTTTSTTQSTTTSTTQSTTTSTITSTTTSSSTSSPNSQATTIPSSGAVRITEGFLMFIPIITISRLLSLA